MAAESLAVPDRMETLILCERKFDGSVREISPGYLPSHFYSLVPTWKGNAIQLF